MGRKPKSAKAEEKANANENSDPPLESMEDKQRSLSSLPSKKKLSKKASLSMNAFNRRSARLRNLRLSMSNKEKIVEEIDLTNSDQEEEPLVQQLNSELQVENLNSEPLVQQLNSEPLVQQSNSELQVQNLNSEPLVQQLNSEPLVQQFNSEPISNLQNLEEKIDFLFQSVKEFKSQKNKRPFQTEIHSADINYRSLYIDSQKKIEALTEENHQLAKKLEFANGKAEAFEQMKDAFGNLRDMVLMSNMARATEAVINLSSQAAIGRFSLPEATTHDTSPRAAEEHKTASPATHKKYARKKK